MEMARGMIADLSFAEWVGQLSLVSTFLIVCRILYNISTVAAVDG